MGHLPGVSLTFLSVQQEPLPEEPPTEFRIFKAGWNESSKGSFLFDALAAKSVMSRYQRDGHDLIVDLEHLSVSDDAQLLRVDAKDARAHFTLEMRGAELWAANVRWTPDGEKRLRERTQRYISQAFLHDKKTKRIVYLANVALVSMPATFGAPALVAASKSFTPLQRGRAYQILEKMKNGS